MKGNLRPHCLSSQPQYSRPVGPVISVALAMAHSSLVNLLSGSGLLTVPRNMPQPLLPVLRSGMLLSSHLKPFGVQGGEDCGRRRLPQRRSQRWV
jgi:hypothetical protein